MSYNELNYVRGYLAGKSMNLSLKTLKFIEEKHKGQIRRGTGEPYFYHPLKVASFLISLGIEDDSIITVALLHDVLEDCQVSILDFTNLGLNNNIIKSVELLTKPEDFEKTPEHYKKYYEGIATDPIAILVKLGDRCHNLLSMDSKFTKEKAQKYVQEAKDYLIPITKNARWNYPQYSNAFYIFKNIIEGINNILYLN